MYVPSVQLFTLLKSHIVFAFPCIAFLPPVFFDILGYISTYSVSLSTQKQVCERVALVEKWSQAAQKADANLLQTFLLQRFHVT